MLQCDLQIFGEKKPVWERKREKRINVSLLNVGKLSIIKVLCIFDIIGVEHMDQVKETLTGFLIGIGIYTLLIEAVGFFFSEDILSYTLGLLFGAGIAVFLFFHMAKTLDRALDLPEAQASRYVRKQSFLRLFIMLLVMIIGLIFSWLNFITIVLGMLGLKLGALMAPFFLKKLYPDSFVTADDEEEG